MNWIRSIRQQCRSLMGLQRSHPARIDPSAVIHHEGVIENFRYDRDSIRVGANTHVRGRLLTYGHGGKITIGEWCYVGIRTEIWSMESIQIGNRVLIAHDVNIHDGTGHSLDPRERHGHYRYILEHGHPRTTTDLPGVRSAPVVIEDDVWVSFGVIILKGVRIGAGSVIGAGSIVTKNVPPGTLYHSSIETKMTPLSTYHHT